MATDHGTIKIQSFVLFDTETTGLPSPGNNPRITELCFLALTRDELTMKSSQPRAINKLTLCFNPMKMISATSSKITGLHNDSLEQLATFKKQASLVCDFLKNLPQPTCLIAHNGNRFDFPLLVAHLIKSKQEIPEGLLCADSLEAFRSFDGLPPVPSFAQAKLRNSSPARPTSPEHGKIGKTPGQTASPESQTKVGASQNGETQSDPQTKGCNSPDGKVQNIRPMSPRKRTISEWEKEGTLPMPGDQDKADTISHAAPNVTTHWHTSDIVTPAKKIQQAEPESPTKHEVDAHRGAMSRLGNHSVRQNLFGGEASSDGDAASYQSGKSSHRVEDKSVESLITKSPDRENCKNQASPHDRGSAIIKQEDRLPDRNIAKCKKELFPAEAHCDASFCEEVTESQSALSSLTDSENFLMEAAEEAEKVVGLEAKTVLTLAEAQAEHVLKDGFPRSLCKPEEVSCSSILECSSSHTPDDVSTSPKCNPGTDEAAKPPAGSSCNNNLPKVSYSLPKIYARLFGQTPPVSHTAEDDCLTMLQIIRNVTIHKFPAWCDKNAVPLTRVEPMF